MPSLLPPPSALKSLAEAARAGARARALDLTKNETDLLCNNIMCEKLLEPCVCRLSKVLERLPCLETLSLRNNGLTALPDNIWSLPSLRALDLSDNDLPAEAILAPNPPPFASLKCLRWLGLAGNPRVSVRSGEDLERWRRALSAGPPSLHRLVVSGPGEEVLVWQRAAAWGPDGGAWRLHGWNGATGSPGALDR